MSNIWTPMPRFFGAVDGKQYVKQTTCILLCIFVLSGCGPIASVFDSNNNANNAPQTNSSNDSSANAPIAPMSPPVAGQRPAPAGTVGTTYDKDGLPELQPSRGVNVDELFAADISDPVQRVQRVENAVIELRRDLDAVMPAIVRLVAIEKDMAQLVTQLQTLLRNEPPTAPTMPAMNEPQDIDPEGQRTERPVQPPAQAAPPPRQAVAAQSEDPPQQAAPSESASPAIQGDVTVKRLRIGEHSDKTRLVLDVGGKPQYSYDLDNSENLLVIELPNAGWSGQQSWSSSKVPLMASYSVQPSGDGSRLIIQLKKPVRVIKDTILAPNGSPDHRLVIDLAAQ